ncbi:MAG TPA: M56 family metallopeptidase, partial [Parafilimonas sp.]|nr:M56 family metallopeptidase [Parafilimonas sp.]
MQTFLESSFLQSLAFALLSSIWQMGLLWFATILFIRLFNLSSAQKFNIAFIAQLSGFVLFISTLVNAYQNDVSLASGAGAHAGNIYVYINVLMPYVAIVYLAMLVYKIVNLFFVYKVTQSLRQNDLHKMSATTRMFVEDISSLFSLRRKVRIYLSSKIKCPLTIGFLKPVILIPIAAVNYLSTEQMEAVILHELAHIKRADYGLFLLQAVIEKIFFFNIFSRMLGTVIEHERENACDDWVLQFKYNSIHYAEALLKLAKLQSSSSLAMAAAGKKNELLLVRIKRLMRRSDAQIEYKFNSLLFCLFTMIIAFGAMASFTLHEPVQSPQLGKQTQKVIEKPNTEITLSGISPAARMSIQNSRQKFAPSEKLTAQADPAKTPRLGNHSDAAIEMAANAPINVDPAYLINVNTTIDSLVDVAPAIDDAINKQLVLTPESYQKALSYQNFRQLETMLATTGDSVRVVENESSKDSYRKLITIEATDKNGNKHVYNVIVE